MLTVAMQLGLVLGLKHASDADHVCTIAALLRAERGLGDALRTAAWWGLGHSLTFGAVGALAVGLDLRLPAPLQLGAELTVGVLLVGLGLAQWHQAARPPGPAASARRSTRTLGLGLVHGLAGSAGVSLLALSTMDGRGPALLYLLLFGVGTVLGMLLVTLALSLPLGAVSRSSPAWRVRVLRAAAAFSILAGAWVLRSTLLA